MANFFAPSLARQRGPVLSNVLSTSGADFWAQVYAHNSVLVFKPVQYPGRERSDLQLLAHNLRATDRYLSAAC